MRDPSRWAISHVIRASTATETIITSPITTTSIATIGICSYTDQEALLLPQRQLWTVGACERPRAAPAPGASDAAAAFRALCAQVRKLRLCRAAMARAPRLQAIYVVDMSSRRRGGRRALVSPSLATSATSRTGSTYRVRHEPTGVQVDVADSPDPARHSSVIRT